MVEGENTGVMFCIARDSVYAELLPGWRQTRPRMRRLGDVVASSSINTPDAAERLARSLLADWPATARRRFEEADRVLWCPDGTWHRFPAVLAGRSGPVTRVPAAAVLAKLRSSETFSVDPARILAMAGPDPLGPGPLPGAAAEVSWLEAHFKRVRILSAGTADLETVAWHDTDVLHLAAHTGLDSRQPWNTSITLARRAGGRLFAADVAGLDLQARLVVLTGCTTVGSRLVGGEGLIGLTGAFLVAGAPTVLATLWPVDDAAAMRVTTVFYEGLADGLPADLALDRSRRICRADSSLAAPRYWAGFTLVGDGETTVSLRRRASRWPWAILLAGMSVVVYRRSRY
ncbi:hypothetical protein DRQ50_08930 [bacterium]|nr:MAG: hypothetical protein DRQ50_08930 [bacterium]